jgi:Zn-dependent protease with chaperone function
MHTKSWLTALLLLHLTCFYAKAQITPVYTFLQDDTVLNRKYYNEALNKKKQIFDNLKKENNKDYKEAYNSMFEMVEDLLISPRAITSAIADNYIKTIAGKIINANTELKDLDVRIVFSRDYIPNAYSIGDGTIAFNAGLFVYLKNEAEMAFVLCHELAHYYLAHSQKKIEQHIELINSDSLKKEIKRIAKQEYRAGEQMEKLLRTFAFNSRRHSRNKEEEADRVGLHFLKNTGYSGKGFITVMELLDKIDDTAYFNTLNLPKILSLPTYPFKEKWIKKESIIFGAMNPDDTPGLSIQEKDSLKTHPDCYKRINMLRREAEEITGTFFSVDEKLFERLKKDFIPEVVEAVFNDGNLSFNLYLCLQMLQEGLYQPLAIYSIARDLNIIYKYQKNHELGLMLDTENRKFKDDYNQLLRMLYRLRLSEIAEINVAFCNQFAEQMKGYTGFEEEMKKANEYKLAHH